MCIDNRNQGGKRVKKTVEVQCVHGCTSNELLESVKVMKLVYDVCISLSL